MQESVSLPFILSAFTEHLLCARLFRPWEHCSGGSSQTPHPRGTRTELTDHQSRKVCQPVIKAGEGPRGGEGCAVCVQCVCGVGGEANDMLNNEVSEYLRRQWLGKN